MQFIYASCVAQAKVLCQGILRLVVAADGHFTHLCYITRCDPDDGTHGRRVVNFPIEPDL